MANVDKKFHEALNVPFSFVRRPSPLAAQERLSWEVPFLLLSLRVGSRAGRSSIARLQILLRAALDEGSKEALEGTLSDPVHALAFPIIDLDPGLELLISLTTAAGLLCKPAADKVLLTERGTSHADSLLRQAVLKPETDRLRSLKTVLTEGALKRLHRVGEL